MPSDPEMADLNAEYVHHLVELMPVFGQFLVDRHAEQERLLNEKFDHMFWGDADAQ
jgi:hypothetical protein